MYVQYTRLFDEEKNEQNYNNKNPAKPSRRREPLRTCCFCIIKLCA